MAKLMIVLPATRDYCGRAVLLSGGGRQLFGPFRVLGTASRYVSRRNGNPTHERRLPFGDPPAGTYMVAGSLPPSTRRRRPKRFGNLGALVLKPAGGEALALAEARQQVILHGGRCDKRGRLRRTRGGLRVADADLSQLLAHINKAQVARDPLVAIEILDAPRTVIDERRSIAPLVRSPRGQPASRNWKAAAVMLCGVGAVARTSVSRRQFLRTVLVLCGGLSLAACDHPAPCDQVACDPNADPTCPPDGYYCADYTTGGGVG